MDTLQRCPTPLSVSSTLKSLDSRALIAHSAKLALKPLKGLNMRFLVVTLSAAVLVSSAVIAAEPTPPASTPEKTAKATQDVESQKVTCRKYEVTGSRLGGSSVCHTKAQWDSIDASNRAYNEDALKPRLTGPQM